MVVVGQYRWSRIGFWLGEDDWWYPYGRLLSVVVAAAAAVVVGPVR